MFFASQLNIVIGTAAIVGIGLLIIASVVGGTVGVVIGVKKHRAKVLAGKQTKTTEEQVTETLVDKDVEKLVNTEDFNENSNYDYVYLIDIKTGKKDDKSEFSLKTNSRKSVIESLIQDARASITTYLNNSVSGIDFQVKYKTESGEIKTFKKHYEMTNGNSETLTAEFENDIKSIVSGITKTPTSEVTSTYNTTEIPEFTI